MKVFFVMAGGLAIIFPVGYWLISSAIYGQTQPWWFCAVYVMVVTAWAMWLGKLEMEL
jgi:hypothetical protein